MCRNREHAKLRRLAVDSDEILIELQVRKSLLRFAYISKSFVIDVSYKIVFVDPERGAGAPSEASQALPTPGHSAGHRSYPGQPAGGLPLTGIDGV